MPCQLGSAPEPARPLKKTEQNYWLGNAATKLTGLPHQIHLSFKNNLLNTSNFTSPA
jgi:hypothetical protein